MEIESTSLEGLEAALETLQDGQVHIEVRTGLGFLCLGSCVSQPLCAAVGSSSCVLVFGVHEELSKAAGSNTEMLSSFFEHLLVSEDWHGNNSIVVARDAKKCVMYRNAREAIERSDLSDCIKNAIAPKKLECGNIPIVGDVKTAENTLARIIAATPSFECPILVTSTSGLIGQRTSFPDESLAFEIYDQVDYAGVHELHRNTLVKQFEQNGLLINSVENFASFDLLGSSADAAESVSLLAAWRSNPSAPNRLLGSPALLSDESVLIVRRNTQETSSSFFADLSLSVLRLLLQFKTRGSLCLDKIEIRNSWRDHVNFFFQLAVSGELYSRNRVGMDETGAVRDENYTCLSQHRFNYDFTEHFWENVIIHAESQEEMLYALREMLRLMRSGKLLPFLDKANETLIADLSRFPILMKTGQDFDGSAFERLEQILETPEISESIQAVIVENLVQLGMFKLKRDFASWFTELGEDFLVLLGEEESLGLKQFQKFRNALKLVATVRGVRCPMQEAKLLLHAATENDNAGTFILFLRGQIPWVKEDANLLPEPVHWQVKQKDKRLRLSQTTWFSNNALQMCELSLDKVKARKLLEESNLIRGLVEEIVSKKGNDKFCTINARAIKI